MVSAVVLKIGDLGSNTGEEAKNTNGITIKTQRVLHFFFNLLSKAIYSTIVPCSARAAEGGHA